MSTWPQGTPALGHPNRDLERKGERRHEGETPRTPKNQATKETQGCSPGAPRRLCTLRDLYTEPDTWTPVNPNEIVTRLELNTDKPVSVTAPEPWVIDEARL